MTKPKEDVIRKDNETGIQYIGSDDAYLKENEEYCQELRQFAQKMKPCGHIRKALKVLVDCSEAHISDVPYSEKTVIICKSCKRKFEVYDVVELWEPSLLIRTKIKRNSVLDTTLENSRRNSTICDEECWDPRL